MYTWVIVRCIMLFSTLYQLYPSHQGICPCFPGVLFANIPHNVLSKPLAAFRYNNSRDNGKCERDMTVGKTIINTLHVLIYFMLPTDYQHKYTLPSVLINIIMPKEVSR